MPDTMTVNDTEYTVLRLLGKGKGGYSYLAADEAGNEFVLKQLHHEPCDYYQFGNKFQSELRDYARLKKIGIPMPKLLDADEQQERILKTYIRGKTIAQLVAEGAMQPDYYRQMEKMCSLCTRRIPILTTIPPILWCRTESCIISILNATTICSSGILKPGESSIGY